MKTLAFIECQFFSETLCLSSSMNVLIPQSLAYSRRNTDKLPVLYLLHGLSADHTDWTRHSSIERFAGEKGLVVVMPNVSRSYYMDMEYGLPYFTFLSQELPEIVCSLFPVSDRREDTFVAGMSMGGYGAFKLGLRCPERFAAAASLSGGLDLVGRMNGPSNYRAQELKGIFGDVSKLAGSDNDLLYLLDQLESYEGNKPKLFQCCGTEDFLYKDNQTFREHALQLGIDVTYEEGHGAHDWEYWEPKIRRVLDWLPL